MLLEFTVENYLSFKDKTVFSMIATKNNEKIDEQTVTINSKLSVLKNAAIYGANASGKSNLLKAIQFMKHFVINSSKESQQGDVIKADSFKFNTESEKKPSVFEVVFLYDSIVYRYGFEVIPEKVVSEWLFARYTARETQLFVRNEQDFQVGVKFKEGKKYIESVRENALFLSVCAQFNGSISSGILKWFRNTNVISSLEQGYEGVSLNILNNSSSEFTEQKQALIDFVKEIDVGIENITIKDSEKIDLKTLLEELPQNKALHIRQNLKNMNNKDLNQKNNSVEITPVEIKSIHNKYDKNKKLISSDDYDFSIESQGTQKIFALVGPIIDTMYRGGILFIDEIQNSLNTTLVIAVIKFFVKNKINIKSQFIFTTHDVNILAADILRRDEFWFVEKNKYGESELTCLVDFDEHVRKDASLDKDYLRGRYGAIPFLNLEKLYGN